MPSADRHACCCFLARAVAWFAEQGVTIERVLSDNAKAYHSHRWRETCAELGLERRYTRPYRPRTNGKAEALIKTFLREWVYRFTYPSSGHRARALPGFVSGTTVVDLTAHSEAGHRSAASRTCVFSTPRAPS